MKHYLDLIKFSAKQHKKQNRMTKLCIVLAVFLVSVIFGMADMEMRSQMIQAVKTDGSWHAAFVVNEEQGAILLARPEVESAARYGALNYRLKDGYQIEGTETGVGGFDKEFQEMIPDAEVIAGTFPDKPDEAVMNENIKARLGVQIGDTIHMTTPWGNEKEYHITGLVKNTALTAELDAFCIFLNTDGFSELYEEQAAGEAEELYFVKFRRFCNIQKTIDEITVQLGLKEGQVRQNVKVLALMIQSRDSYMMQFYFVAAALAMLVVIAGILMITASMNSSIARRTEFFGMLRCLGAVKGQVIRYVQREALEWCRIAIPAGVAAGVVVVWGVCGLLRFLSPGLFEGLPVFGVSFMGIGAGIIVGFLTVFLAAGSPAKQAARVSPLTAVSGNAGTVHAVKRTADTRFFKVDTALGIHHAAGSKKNFLLVSGSFAFSIILFLAFSTAIDFMHHAINPLRPSAPDIRVNLEDGSNQIPAQLAKELEKAPGVKRVFGRGYAGLTMPDGRQITAVSYGKYQFQWAEESMLEGSLKDASEGKGVLFVSQEEDTPDVGSHIKVLAGGKERDISVAGIIGGVPDMTDTAADMMFCQEDLFRELTGEKGYAVLDIQLQRNARDVQVQEIRQIIERACGDGIIFSDKRIKNQEARGASYSMAVFMYGFLAVIALIGFFNIINCIAMSVSARIKEYGAMRAIGMSTGQLERMVVGETLTYAFSGAGFGCALGLPLNWLMFDSLVTSRWKEAWSIPGWELAAAAAVMAVSVLLAVSGPARQLKDMIVVDIIR